MSEVEIHAEKKNIAGPKIRSYCLEHGWTQAEFATKCQVAGLGYSRDTIQRIEQQSRWVGDQELKALAKVLKVSVEDLLLN